MDKKRKILYRYIGDEFGTVYEIGWSDIVFWVVLIIFLIIVVSLTNIF
jgi:hypothetical protein